MIAGKGVINAQSKTITYKQTMVILFSITVAVILQTFGFFTQYIGFLFIASILYMLPHIAGIKSSKMKTFIGIVFIILSTLAVTFYSGPSMVNSMENNINIQNDDIKGIVYNNSSGELSILCTSNITGITITTGVVSSFNYNSYRSDLLESYNVKLVDVVNDGNIIGYNGTCTINLKQDKINSIQIDIHKKAMDGDSINDDSGCQYNVSFFVNNGISYSELQVMSLKGVGIYVAFTASMFFMILIFSTIIRKTIEKARIEMEKDGRLYPNGYGRCKKCGSIVLPGEITCRKCGGYIDIPDNIRAKKKDFFICSECGTEVSEDSEKCPKCGVMFDSIENEIIHQDGSIEIITETKVCPSCNIEMPVDAQVCPKCGYKIKK